MKEKDVFMRYHPFVNFVFFSLTIGFSLVLTHPAAQGIALFSALFSYLFTSTGKEIAFLFKLSLPILFLSALLNPLFNPAGATVLLYIGEGKPITLESLLYGCSAGVMTVTVLIWFLLFGRVMTSDKFIYLFGRVTPSLSLVLSMALGFVPRFTHQLKQVVEAQKSMGRDIAAGSLFARLKTLGAILSVMVSWSLENAIDTADSMKSRGYGLKGRSAFSLYHMRASDVWLLLWCLLCFVLLVVGVLLSVFDFRFFPRIGYPSFDLWMLPFYIVYFALCATTLFLNWKETITWNCLYSGM